VEVVNKDSNIYHQDFGTIRIKINQDTQAAAGTIIQQSRIDATNDRKWSGKQTNYIQITLFFML
jgi:hypothetical protein